MKPASHSHAYDPSVLTQVADGPHGLPRHSSTSVESLTINHGAFLTLAASIESLLTFTNVLLDGELITGGAKAAERTLRVDALDRARVGQALVYV